MAPLMNGGHSKQVACDKLHRHCNAAIVTHIISGLIKDKATYKNSGGMHPNLRVDAVGGTPRVNIDQLLAS